jgi:hypothetical protein
MILLFLLHFLPNVYCYCISFYHHQRILTSLCLKHELCSINQSLLCFILQYPGITKWKCSKI